MGIVRARYTLEFKQEAEVISGSEMADDPLCTRIASSTDQDRLATGTIFAVTQSPVDMRLAGTLVSHHKLPGTDGRNCQACVREDSGA